MGETMDETMGETRARGFDFRTEGLGLLVFTAGSFFTVLLGLAIGSSVPLEEVRGTGFLARMWVASIGVLPSMLLCAGMAVLGAREFLAGGGTDWKRHAKGLASTALGLSVLCGAFSETAGGFLGAHTAGALSRTVHLGAGALVGLAAFVLPIWVVWLRSALVPVAAADRAGPSSPPDRAPASRVPILAPADDVGVSPAEAAALIPEEPPSWRSIPRKQAVTAEALVPSPYPEDVRLRGEIPEGAQAFQAPHVESPKRALPPSEPAVPAVQHRAPAPEPRPSAYVPRLDLAPVEASDGSDPVLEMPSEIGRRAQVSEADELRLALEELRLEEAIDEPEPAVGAALEPGEPEASELPKPSWEQTDLFEVDEEPVDAYGTPISVVEQAPEAGTAAAVEAGPEEIAPAPAEAAEREVTLAPAPAGRKKSRAKATSHERTKLLTEIGCLLVDRGRVAVSMLQKQYGMDFEEATRTLDELQGMGLIGPYLGGQRRDILLTRDEWLEKVSGL